jgi:hypothetical protein
MTAEVPVTITDDRNGTEERFTMPEQEVRDWLGDLLDDYVDRGGVIDFKDLREQA